MNIMFLCGSLEPGKDGVGDYTRLIAKELMQQGHNVAAISLNDKYIAAIHTKKDDVFTDILRLPASSPWKERFRQAQHFIDVFNPEWISLQYVPYSFNKKGFAWHLIGGLKRLTNGRKFHIMFHEMWVGISKISPLKHKIYGFFQRKIASAIIKATKPDAISTSNILYQLVLRSENINAEILPLFSNIPRVKYDPAIIETLFSKMNLKIEECKIVGIFGSLYPQAALEAVLADLVEKATNENKNLVFLSIGRVGAYGEKEFERLSLLFKDKITFVFLGEKSQEVISSILQVLDVGISCTPVQHLGKSGVFAALRLHGVNVEMSGSEELPEYKEEISEYFKEFIKRPPELWGVESTTKKFLQLLK